MGTLGENRQYGLVLRSGATAPELFFMREILPASSSFKVVYSTVYSTVYLDSHLPFRGQLMGLTHTSQDDKKGAHNFTLYNTFQMYSEEAVYWGMMYTSISDWINLLFDWLVVDMLGKLIIIISW